MKYVRNLHFLKQRSSYIGQTKGTNWWLLNIGLGNYLRLSANKPLPEQILTTIYDIKKRYPDTINS